MSLISRRSGASAGIIYHYFENKDDLLQSLYRRIKSDMGHALAAVTDPCQPLARRFQRFWLGIFHSCVAHPQEMAFLEQYESLPTGKQQAKQEYESLLTTRQKDLPLDIEAKVLLDLIEDLRTQDLLKVPYEVIGEFTLGVALRLARQSATGGLNMNEAMLAEIARACWDAIAR